MKFTFWTYWIAIELAYRREGMWYSQWMSCFCGPQKYFAAAMARRALVARAHSEHPFLGRFCWPDKGF